MAPRWPTLIYLWRLANARALLKTAPPSSFPSEGPIHDLLLNTEQLLLPLLLFDADSDPQVLDVQAAMACQVVPLLAELAHWMQQPANAALVATAPEELPGRLWLSVTRMLDILLGIVDQEMEEHVGMKAVQQLQEAGRLTGASRAWLEAKWPYMMV